MVKLAKKAVPKRMQAEVLVSDKGIKEWVSGYVEEIYLLGELLESDSWTTARDEPLNIVEEVLKLTGLKQLGYKAKEMHKDELRLQKKWQSEGDWRYGSTPILPAEETPKKIPDVPLPVVLHPTTEQNACPPSHIPTALKTTRNDSPGLHCSFSKEHRGMYKAFDNPCSYSQEQRRVYNPFGTSKRDSDWTPTSEELVDISYEEALEGLDGLSVTTTRININWMK